MLQLGPKNQSSAFYQRPAPSVQPPQPEIKEEEIPIIEEEEEIDVKDLPL